MSKDYYNILGIDEYATPENIKSAYRKLARKWHPDIAGNSPDVLKTFKDINEAYEILSNNVKKAEYDRAKRFYDYAKSSTNKESEVKSKSTETETSKNKFNFKWEEFISKYQKSNKNKEHIPEPTKGHDIFTDMEISIIEALTGTNKTINVLQREICPKCNGKKFANGTICQHCMGKGVKNNYRKFNVKVPSGVSNGSKIRLAGEGEKGKFGGKNGDLYISIHIQEQKDYRTEGLNIFKTIRIQPHDAVLGSDISINTFNGNVKLKITPNTQNGQKFRLSGCGLVQNNKIGDMIVTVEVEIPENLTEEEINLYKKLREISSSNIGNSIYDR